jgi:hypothetical protein
MGQIILKNEQENIKNTNTNELDYEIIETKFPLDFALIFRKDKNREECKRKQRNSSLSRYKQNSHYDDMNSRLSHDSKSIGICLYKGLIRKY